MAKSKGTRANRHPQRRRRILIGILLGLLTLGSIGFYTWRHLEGNIHRMDVSEDLGPNRPAELDSGPDRAINVLIMGSDTRKGSGNQIEGKTPGLSDTTILLHVAKNRQFAYGVSLPRDAMVKRPECKRKDGTGMEPAGITQFNFSYEIGGPACTIKTVESLTGIRIENFVVIDFNGFKNMVDAVGGVDICVPKEIDDPIGKIYLKAGRYLADGQTALDYVRVRHGVGDGSDIGRMKRQQTFVAAMISKVMSAGTIANPVKIVSFLDAATKSLTTDPELGRLTRLAGLGLSVSGIGLGKIKFLTVPIHPYPADPNRLEWTDKAQDLWELIKQDQPLSKEFNGEAVTPKPTAKPSGKPNKPKPTQSPLTADGNGLCA